MQIAIKCLLGWGTDDQVGQEEVFGILEAQARIDEEQGRTRSSFLQFVDRFICAHYGNVFVVNHECRKGTV